MHADAEESISGSKTKKRCRKELDSASSSYADERRHMTARERAQSGTPKETQNLLVPTKDGKRSDLHHSTISHRISIKPLANRISPQTAEQRSNKLVT
ncbi:hypothetical protein PGTUg99_002200 [Puccinia graminis f. sp. tritici]|uniref:Uncharacterized protein n=1 Tax=Puccinia graminis f. sp. tritici TaxID=56615 RepID=A0A5B0RBN2_PUCGR|nr:hypothetical protein PGTUg99_002200 [Puccinia graminis f. sp. tritici]